MFFREKFRWKFFLKSCMDQIMTWGILFAIFWMGLGAIAFLYLLKSKDAS